MLKISNISAFYGKLQALWDVSFQVGKEEIVTLVGANAAGKTTILNTISNLIHPTSGTVEFLGSRIDEMSPHKIVGLGIAHIPEGLDLFPDMTVHENLELGAYQKQVWKKRDEISAKVYDLFPILRAKAGQLAKTLSGGEQQLLAIGRGLMSEPTLCMLDEPSSGLAPIIFIEVFETVKKLRAQGMTVLVVEQNTQLALETADRAYVLENGRVTLEGRSADVLQDDHVKVAYLGL